MVVAPPGEVCLFPFRCLNFNPQKTSAKRGAIAAQKRAYHDNEDVRGRVDDLIQSDDVWMTAHSQYVNLSTNFVHHVERLDPTPIDDLDSHFSVGHHVLSDCTQVQQKR